MDLLRRLQSGDESAFDAIFRQWYAPLVRFADSIVRSRAIAEEIVQDVMLELWRRREALSPDSSVQAYLFQSTRNRSLNHIRHERVERRAEPGAEDEYGTAPAASSALLEAEIDTAVRNAVAGLPDRCREVFELSRSRGLKYSEIATALGISVKTVESQMGKALRILRERLAPFLPDGDSLLL